MTPPKYSRKEIEEAITRGEPCVPAYGSRNYLCYLEAIAKLLYNLKYYKTENNQFQEPMEYKCITGCNCTKCPHNSHYIKKKECEEGC